MLNARIIVDLPSAELERKQTLFERLRSLLGATIDLRSGHEEITVGAFALVGALADGFAAAGVTDAISFLIDRNVIYMDNHEVHDDLPEIVRLAEMAGVLDKTFTEMHLVMAHRSATLHTIFDCRITNRVILGHAEMTVDVSGRLFETQIQPGEAAKAYADRIKQFAAREASFEPARGELDILVERVANSLERTLPGSRIGVQSATVRIVRPDRAQIGRFKQLGFGAEARRPSYRSVPTKHRHGAYSDPFYYYYYDPYYDYVNYYLVDSILDGSGWHSPHVHVVDPHGTELFTADRAPAASDACWVGPDAVQFDAAGTVQVDPACEEASRSTFSDSGPGTGTSEPSAWTEHSSSSSSDDTSRSSCSQSACSSSSSTTSCGSSCSSTSSCGSSCSSSD